MSATPRRVITATIGILALGAFPSTAVASPGTGLTVTTLVTAKLEQDLHAKGDRIKLQTERA